MRLIFALVSIILFANTVDCQTFFPMPGPLAEQEVGFELANESFIHFDNPGGDTIRLRWRKMEASIPEGWDIDLCDYGVCYVGIPPNGLMNPIYGNTQAYLKLVVQPDTFPGAAWLWFRVHEDGNNSNFQDVYFSFHTPGTTRVQESAPSEIRFWPNPADSRCHFRNDSNHSTRLRLSNTAGQLFFDFELPQGNQHTLPLDDLPAGLYLLQSGRETQKLLIVH